MGKMHINSISLKFTKKTWKWIKENNHNFALSIDVIMQHPQGVHEHALSDFEHMVPVQPETIEELENLVAQSPTGPKPEWNHFVASLPLVAIFCFVVGNAFLIDILLVLFNLSLHILISFIANSGVNEVGVIRVRVKG